MYMNNAVDQLNHLEPCEQIKTSCSFLRVFIEFVVWTAMKLEPSVVRVFSAVFSASVRTMFAHSIFMMANYAQKSCFRNQKI